jgi:hypothetical protein
MKLEGKWRVYIESSGRTLNHCREVELIPATSWVRFLDGDGVLRLACGDLLLTAEQPEGQTS